MNNNSVSEILTNKLDKWITHIEKTASGTVFDEAPVPLDDFLYSGSYLNLAKLSDKQYELIQYGTQIYYDKELDELGWSKVRRVGELVAYWGKGGGKDFCSSIILARIADLLLHLNCPQKYYNQAEITSIDMLNMAYNSDQAQSVFFKTFSAMVDACKYFSNKCEIKNSSIQFDKRIAAYSGNSFEEAFEGKNLIVAVLDEISAFKTKFELEQMSMRRLRAPRYSAESVFDMAKSSVESRFGNGIGKVISLSFPRFKNDYIQQLYNIGKDEKTCYVSFGATWDVNPTKRKEDFADEFRKNPERAEARYACNPTSVEGGYFTNKEAISRAFPLIPTDRVPSTDDKFPTLKPWFKCLHSHTCSIHIDLGLKHDKAGFCMSHISGTIPEAVIDEQGKRIIVDKPIVTIDLLTSFIAPINGEIDFSLIRQLVADLVNRGFKIGILTLDQFQSSDFKQIISKLGIETDIRSVDRNTDAYDCLKELIYDNRLKGYSYIRNIETALGTIQKNEIIDELNNLILIGGKKLDHPGYGCFTSDTRISLVDGRELSFLELLEEQKHQREIWVYAIDSSTKQIVAKKAINVRKTKSVNRLIRITLDNGEIIDCTFEHLFMDRQGNYFHAQELIVGQSLMPLYRKYPSKGQLTEYRMIYNPFTNVWNYEHRRFCIGEKQKGQLVHHINFNKSDNSPLNLKFMSKSEHTRIHNNLTKDYRKISESVTLWHKNNKETDSYLERNIRISEACKKQDSRNQKFPSQICRLIKALRKRIILLGGEEYLETIRITKMVIKLKQNHRLGKFKKAYVKLQEFNLSDKGRKIHSVTMKRLHTEGLISHECSDLTRETARRNITTYNKSEERISKLKANGQFSRNGTKALTRLWANDEFRRNSSTRMSLQNKVLVEQGIHNFQIATKSIHEMKFCDVCNTTFTNIPHQNWAAHRRICKKRNTKVLLNHKITSIEQISATVDVFDLEVPGCNNFALSAGIFVHNSKDCSDSLSGSVQGAIELGYSNYNANDFVQVGNRESINAEDRFADREYLSNLDDEYFTG